MKERKSEMEPTLIYPVSSRPFVLAVADASVLPRDRSSEVGNVGTCGFRIASSGELSGVLGSDGMVV